MNNIEVYYCIGLFLLNVGLCCVWVKAKDYPMAVLHAFVALFLLAILPLIIMRVSL